MESTSVCPKCNGTLEEGFVFYFAGGSNIVNTWVEGPPEKDWLRGTKIAGRRQFKTVTYRCHQCGYLESYAREQVK